MTNQTQTIGKPLTAFHLKLIALFIMVIDHTTAALAAGRAAINRILKEDTQYVEPHRHHGPDGP